VKLRRRDDVHRKGALLVESKAPLFVVARMVIIGALDERWRSTLAAGDEYVDDE
jgi:hypothetical protein